MMWLIFMKSNKRNKSQQSFEFTYSIDNVSRPLWPSGTSWHLLWETSRVLCPKSEVCLLYFRNYLFSILAIREEYLSKYQIIVIIIFL
jgi:hypothetical protein